ncbi:MAG: SDR family oxidoreductase [Aquabacterium sp.]|nr:SDR family oxidoreductase [Aquabacterium sp.]
MTSQLQGKVALITGAARGIGAATARLFAAEGAIVVLCDVRLEEGKALTGELPGAVFVPLDVSSEPAWQAAVADTLARHGRLDILVNNAGLYKTAPLEETSLDLFMRTVQVNQVGPFLGMKSVIPVMKAQGAGAIVNVSSTSGLKGNQNSMAYGSTKWALRGMSKIAAVELGEYGIRVNSVHPGLIDTPMNHEEMGHDRIREIGMTVPLRRPGRAQDIAQMILFLASDASSYVTGTENVCDGGMTAGTLRTKFTARLDQAAL